MSIKKITGNYCAKDMKFAIVTARFNELVTERLTSGAVDCILRHGGSEENITLAEVPGAFELPVVGEKAAASGNYDAVILLGAVIKGDTPHFDTVTSGVTSGTMSLGLKHTLPVIFGVLTTNTVEEALNRAGVKAGNKGWEAALTAIETVDVLRQF